MINRELITETLRVGNDFPVLILTGPRQSGKTTLCKMAFPGYKYINLENPDTRDAILADPMSFLKGNTGGMILDEAQQLPELFSYIQVLVDEDKTLRYVLSGSNNFTLMERVTQSLAGRAALLTLLPLSISEIKLHRLNRKVFWRFVRIGEIKIKQITCHYLPCLTQVSTTDIFWIRPILKLLNFCMI